MRANGDEFAGGRPRELEAILKGGGASRSVTSYVCRRRPVSTTRRGTRPARVVVAGSLRAARHPPPVTWRGETGPRGRAALTETETAGGNHNVRRRSAAEQQLSGGRRGVASGGGDRSGMESEAVLDAVRRQGLRVDSIIIPRPLRPRVLQRALQAETGAEVVMHPNDLSLLEEVPRRRAFSASRRRFRRIRTAWCARAMPSPWAGCPSASSRRPVTRRAVSPCAFTTPCSSGYPLRRIGGSHRPDRGLPGWCCSAPSTASCSRFRIGPWCTRARSGDEHRG